MKKLLVSILFFTLISACGDQKIDTTQARREMESREIKKVSEGEIVEKALQIGNTLTKDLTLSKEGAQILIKNENDSTNERVRFFAFENLNNASTKDKRFRVFEAYEYNDKNALESAPGVQILEGDTILLYTAPAILNNEMVGVIYIDLSRKEVVLAID